MIRKSDRLLVFLLRFLSVSACLALVAVLMPMSWMAATHRWLGLGEMPVTPIVEYLARSLSAFYVLFGALSFVLSADVERYRPLVGFLGCAFAAYGAVFIGVDLLVGMPWWWTASEGPPCLFVGVWIFLLARKVR